MKKPRLSRFGLAASLLLCTSVYATHGSLEEIEYQIKKIGRLNVVDAPASNAGDGASFDPEGAYTAKCSACHAAGVLDAPIMGNIDQWSARIAQGTDKLYSNAVGGLNNMPPKGGAMDLSDEQVRAIVDYMISKSQ